jgi:hypothetical protein
MTHGIEVSADRGVGPFVTLRHLSLPDGHRLWQARDHRKGLGTPLAPRAFWQTRAFNALMAVGFVIGAALFVLGAGLSLRPVLATSLTATAAEINVIYFAGSVFFTLAAYLQLFQSANAGPTQMSGQAPRLRSFVGWRPDDPGWQSSAAQFLGTLLFNANTFDAIQGGGWLRQDLAVWGPDILGSMLFLYAGYLAVIETCHAWWAWRPRSLAWWIVTVNFVGCVAFMVSSIFAFVPPAGAVAGVVAFSTACTLVGAAGFVIGAVLSIVESVTVQD